MCPSPRLAALAALLSLCSCSDVGEDAGAGDAKDPISHGVDGGAAPARGLYLHGATLITGTGQVRLADMAVAIRGDRIVAVEPACEAPAGLHPVDLEGLTLLPGLIDSHVHLGATGNPWLEMVQLLQNGVTTVQDMGNRLASRRESAQILSRCGAIRCAISRP